MHFAVTLVLLCLFGVSADASEPADSSERSGLALELEPVDSTMPPDSVQVRITFTNTSDSAITIYCFQHNQSIAPAIGAWLHFDINLGRLDTWRQQTIGPLPKMPHRSDVKALAPGDSHSEIICLHDYYQPVNSPDWERVSWPEGMYSVRARYHYEHQPAMKGGAALWRGCAESEWVTFQVISQ